MASRAGPRAAGTDGSDYSHREKIASHYQASVDLKLSVKKCLLPHMVLCGFFVFRYVAVLFGSKYFTPLEIWELFWLFSGVCAFVGFGSLSKNDSNRLLFYVVGNVIFGLIPLCYGAYHLFEKMKIDFTRVDSEKNTTDNYRNSPMKMAILAVCVTWQIAGLFQSIKLIRTWKSMNERKKR